MPGCHSKPQKKLSNHLTHKHPGLSRIERQRYLKVAQRVDRPRQRRPADASQPTLTQVVPRMLEARQSTASQSLPRSANAEQQSPTNRNLQSNHLNAEERVGCELDDVKEEPQSDEDPILEDTIMCGMRYFPRFHVDHPVFYCFKRYLMSVDGGEKFEKTAHDMAVDVSSISNMPVDQIPLPPTGAS